MSNRPEVVTQGDPHVNYKTPEAFTKLMDEYFLTIDKDRNNSVSRKELQDIIATPNIDLDFKAAMTVVEQNYKFFENLDSDNGFTRKDLAKFSALTGENFYKDIATRSSKGSSGMSKLAGAAIGGILLGVLAGPEAAPLGAAGGMALVDSVNYNNLTYDAYVQLGKRRKIESMNYFDLKNK